MDEQHIFFWRVIEAELVTKIPSFIKNTLHLCRFGEPVTLKHVDDLAIETVEGFIKDQLRPLIDGWKVLCDKVNDIDFFGYHGGAPENFAFTLGERILIDEIRSYVKKVCDDNNVKLFSFEMASGKRKRVDYNGTFHIKNYGRFFTQHEDVPEAVNQGEQKIDHNPNADLSELSQKLHENIYAMLNLSGVTEKELSEFTVDNVSVVLDNHGVAHGTIVCVLCVSNGTKQNQFKVNSKEIGNKIYWTTSNYKKHLTQFHNMKPSLKASAQQDKKATAKSDSGLGKSEMEVTVDEHPNDDGSTDNLESIIRKQIEAQVIKMNETALNHHEQLHTMDFIHKQKGHSLNVVSILPDGNCIFAALYHQIFRMCTTQNAFKRGVSKLRADVVKYIQEHLQLFQNDLAECVFVQKGGKRQKKDINDQNIKEETDEFLKQLSKDKYWGGSETIKATSLMYEVNILVINENEEIYYANGFNPDFKHTAMIAYRPVTKRTSRSSSNTPRNHFDSIIDIQMEDMAEIANSLANSGFNQNNS